MLLSFFNIKHIMHSFFGCGNSVADDQRLGELNTPPLIILGAGCGCFKHMYSCGVVFMGGG